MKLSHGRVALSPSCLYTEVGKEKAKKSQGWGKIADIIEKYCLRRSGSDGGDMRWFWWQRCGTVKACYYCYFIVVTSAMKNFLFHLISKLFLNCQRIMTVNVVSSELQYWWLIASDKWYPLDNKWLYCCSPSETMTLRHYTTTIAQHRNLRIILLILE